MGSVFISFSSKDELFVSGLLKILTQGGISYWKAPEHIPKDSEYAKAAPAAIEACDVFLLVLSERAQKSVWVEKELDCAVNCRKPVVAIRIDSEPLNQTFQFYIGNAKVISYIENPEEAFLKMHQQLRKLLKEGAVAKKQGRELKTAEENNGVPAVCALCNGRLRFADVGIYRCMECGQEYYDNDYKVKKYLETYGATPVGIIERDTGVPSKKILAMFEEEILEISGNSKVSIGCQICKKPIRTGRYCDRCKEKIRGTKE